MIQVADGVWQIPLAPKESVNAYLIGDVLVDAGTKGMGKKLPAKLSGRTVRAHTLTHGHPDHAGGSKAVCDALGIPFWAPAGDAENVAAGRAGDPLPGIKGKLQALNGRFPAVQAARELHEGDDVAGFTVLDVPGHSKGHIAFWRESDRVLICGDVWFNLLLPRLKPGLRQPFDFVTVDVPQNRRSMQKLIDLRPDVVAFGHGPVLRDAADKLRVVP